MDNYCASLSAWCIHPIYNYTDIEICHDHIHQHAIYAVLYILYGAFSRIRSNQSESDRQSQDKRIVNRPILRTRTKPCFSSGCNGPDMSIAGDSGARY